MSSIERLQKLGTLQELKGKLRRNVTRVNGIRENLGVAMFVIDEDDPYVIDGQKIRDYANDLYAALSAGMKLKTQIEKLEADLGV